jgi:hypothetical protein
MPNPMNAISARPPTTPPTIGPIGVLEDSLSPSSGDEVGSAGTDSVVEGTFWTLISPSTEPLDSIVETVVVGIVLEGSSSDCEVDVSVDSETETSIRFLAQTKVVISRPPDALQAVMHSGKAGSVLIWS